MIIKITPGVDPYAQLDLEEEELEYKVGDETASKIHPDDDDADDLSCITINSMKHIDKRQGQRNLGRNGKNKTSGRGVLQTVSRDGG